MTATQRMIAELCGWLTLWAVVMLIADRVVL